jgi:SulP family sulfate permease
VEDRILEEEHLVAASRAPLGLRDLDLFRGFDDSMFEALAACARERSCETGEKIFGRGDKGDELFVIRRGRVRVILPIPNGKPRHLATFSRGDFFGDMAFLDRGERSADAVAEAPTDLYVLSRARFDEMAERFPAMGKRAFSRLARALAIRLRQADAELQALE